MTERVPERLGIGIDLGGTQLRAALVTRSGTVRRRAAARTAAQDGPEAVLEQIRELVRIVLEDDAPDGIDGVGIAAPGPLDTERGVVLHIPTLRGWDDFALRSALERRLALPVVVENDGIAAAFGEWAFGAAKGFRHALYATIRTGIGGGVIVDGRLLRGRRGMAGHIGHVRLSSDGPRCSCGAVGCFEAYASGTGLAAAATAAAAADPDSALGKLALSGPVDARDLAHCALAGCPVSTVVMEAEARHLGRGFASLCHAYSPEVIVMGGGVSQAFDLLAPTVRATLDRELLPGFRGIRLVRAALDDNSGLLGAAALVFDPSGKRFEAGGAG